MVSTKTLRRVFFLSLILLFTSVIAAGIYTGVSSQKKQNELPPARTYDGSKVTAAPEVRSTIKGLEISGVSLINKGTPEAAVSIDVINTRDEDVMAVDFVAGKGKNTSSGLSMDGLLEEGHPLVIIPRHSLKTFNWNLGSILEGETIFLAVAVFSDGKEEGDQHFLNGLKKSRIKYQEDRRNEKAKNGDQK